MSTTAAPAAAIKKSDRVVHEDRQGVITVATVERLERYRGYDDPSIVITYVKLEGIDRLVSADECTPFTSATDLI